MVDHGLAATLVARLACPDCRADLAGRSHALQCLKCGRDFEIRDGIPLLLPRALAEAEPPSQPDGTSHAYQQNYREVERAERYNAKYSKQALKRASTRREFQLIERLLGSVPRSEVLLDLPSGGGGTSVKKAPPAPLAGGGKKDTHVPNPLASDPKAIKAGAALYQQHCSMCHGDDAKGGIGPSLVDDVFFSVAGDLPDDDYFEVINNGVFPGMVEDGRTAKDTMPGFAKEMNKEKIWSVVAYLRSIKK